MKLRALLPVVLSLAAAPAASQQSSNGDVLSTYLQRAYAAVAKDLAAAVEIMPAADLGFRPAGVVEEVRSFGQIAAHILEVNSWVCTMGDGQPADRFDKSVATDKVKLQEALTAMDARCRAYFSTLTDAKLPEPIRSGTAERQMESHRGSAAIFMIAHANEHYGNLVTYLRAKGLVPPKAASQASFLKPVGG